MTPESQGVARKLPGYFLLRKLATQKIADLSIYTGMAAYIALFIFKEYQSLILCLDIILEFLKIPYFTRVNEQAVVRESYFFIVASLLAIFLNIESTSNHISECIATLGI